MFIANRLNLILLLLFSFLVSLPVSSFAQYTNFRLIEHREGDEPKPQAILWSKEKALALIYYNEEHINVVDGVRIDKEWRVKEIKKEIRDELFSQDHPIYTKDKNTTPTKYEKDAVVTNSFVADGCIINGEVENSIISRSVVIKKGTKISNSIIMQQCDIGENVHLKNVIIDKKVIVRDNKELVGEPNYLVIVGKGKVI